jgi:hypothetical protein
MAALTVGAAIAGSFVGTSERFNPAGPAPLEGSIDVAGDPATIDDPVPTTGT